MNIYFTASTTHDGVLIKNYKTIYTLLEQFGSLISGKQIVNKTLLKKDRQIPTKEIFQREKQLIELADLIVAEVSQPSIGVGGEIVYALVHNKPVLALLFKNQEDKISPMIEGNPSENLFLEYYNFENIRFVLKDFFAFCSSQKQRKGFLVVIDGGDGSGKTTQAKMLLNYLSRHKITSKYIDFPQYYSSFHGKTVARFLRGEFGEIDEVSPYLASLAYALDRVTVKKEVEEFLSKGGIVVANRYATSNMAHQTAKFHTQKEQSEFLKWLYTLEYKVHKMPKENLVIYLHVPWQLSMRLTDKKESRAYLKGQKQDIAEKNIAHRKDSERMYLFLSKKYRHWITVDCVKNNRILPAAEIHRKIIRILKDKHILPEI